MHARLASYLALFSLSLALTMTACARADASLLPVAPAPVTRLIPPTPQISETPSVRAARTAEAPIPTATPLAPFSPATATAAATASVPDEQILRLPDHVPTAIIAPEEIAAPHLVIPGLNLDQEIVKVPALHGKWDLARLGHRVGWLETTGQKPDDRLAMALAGHVTVTAADMGPFANLWKLHVKDEVIYRAGDTDYVYSVKQKIEADPSETWRLYVEDRRQLLLITCAEWDYAAWKYGKRLIVVAEETTRRASP